MRYRTFIAMILCLPACHVFAAAPKEAPAPPAAAGVTVASLQVQKKLPDSQMSLVSGGFGGTTINLLIAQPGKFVIGVDEKASKLEKFADDKGTDLAKSESSFGGAPDWMSAIFAKVSDDGTMIGVPIRSTGSPVAGAREIALKATIVLRCGAGEKTSEQKDVPLAAPGTKIPAGPVTLVIGKPNKVTGNDLVGAQKSVNLTSTTPLDAIKNIEFLDSAGNEIKSHTSGHGSMSFGNMTSYEVTYSLEQKVDTATMRVTYYEKIESVSVPVDLKIGVGF